MSQYQEAIPEVLKNEKYYNMEHIISGFGAMDISKIAHAYNKHGRIYAK
jgi:hypothetical protein